MIYGACAGIVLAALVWITVMVVGLERAELEARADADHQEALRLALWRMDSRRESVGAFRHCDSDRPACWRRA